MMGVEPLGEEVGMCCEGEGVLEGVAVLCEQEGEEGHCWEH